MRTKIVSSLVLCLVMVAAGVVLSAQGGRGGKPQPLSTSPFDVWSGDKLTTPGNLGNFGHYTASIQR